MSKKGLELVDSDGTVLHRYSNIENAVAATGLGAARIVQLATNGDTDDEGRRYKFIDAKDLQRSINVKLTKADLDELREYAEDVGCTVQEFVGAIIVDALNDEREARAS